MTPRTELQLFAGVVERRLRLHDNDKTDWENESVEQLVARLEEEMEGLRQALEDEDPHCYSKAADVAAFAMFVAQAGWVETAAKRMEKMGWGGWGDR